MAYTEPISITISEVETYVQAALTQSRNSTPEVMAAIQDTKMLFSSEIQTVLYDLRNKRGKSNLEITGKGMKWAFGTVIQSDLEGVEETARSIVQQYEQLRNSVIDPPSFL